MQVNFAFWFCNNIIHVTVRFSIIAYFVFYKFSKAFCFGQFSHGLAYAFLSVLILLPGDHLRFHYSVGCRRCLCAAYFVVKE